MKNNKKFFKNVLGSSFLLFMFLFNIVWTAPLGIISQKFPVAELFLFNNPYVRIILIVTLVIMGLSLLNPKIRKIFTHIILFLVISSLLYKNLFAYNFGAFVDDVKFIPTFSLLGFSKWYYLLDCIFISISLGLTYFIHKKEQVLQICGILSIYFIVQLGVVLSKMQISDTNNSPNRIISKNHKNVLLFFFDSLDPNILRYYIMENKLLLDNNILKDFTFYTQSLSPSQTGTPLSLPALYAGKEQSAQQVLAALLETNTYQSIYAPFYHKPVEVLEQLIDNRLLFNIEQSTYIRPYIPILSIHLYQSIPYFSRFLLVEPYQWKYINYVLWGDDELDTDTKEVKYVTQNTEKPTYNFIYSDKTHFPNSVVQTNISLKKVKDTNDFEVLLRYNYSEALETVKEVMIFLKEQNIYDNTTIIIVSDHGAHVSPANKPEIVSHYQTNLNHYSSVDLTYFRDSTALLIKNFNETHQSMQYNNKLVSPILLKDVIFTSLDLTNTTNYLTNDINLVFNIPVIGSAIWSLADVSAWKSVRDGIISSNTMTFHRVSNLKPYEYSTFEVPIEEISNVPPYEIIE